jgi:hypothetical protein
MALMNYREPNQVKWMGTRPGHNGTQVDKANTATNGIAIVYTVTAGKTLYLCTVSKWVELVAVGISSVFLRNVADVFQYNLIYELTVAGVLIPHRSVTFWPPLEVPAGYDICVRSSVAGLTVGSFVFGWEE